jgi:hypothetical protein
MTPEGHRCGKKSPFYPLVISRKQSQYANLIRKKSMSKDNIVDDSKPSAGRMYDYYLGGNHNFEIDRQAADEIVKIMPFAGKFSRLQRWALQDIAVELSQNRGFDVIIDFASGLPTNDHIHLKVPDGTTVIYSDYDPIVVEYSHKILRKISNVHYYETDASHPEELLGSPEVEKILAGRRKVAFVFWGVSIFLANEDISRAMRFLYDWAAPGSCLAFNAQGADMNSKDPVAIKIIEAYEQMGQKPYPRTLEEYVSLVKPWPADEQSFIPLLKWHDLDQSELSQEDATDFGPMGGGYGAYLVK